MTSSGNHKVASQGKLWYTYLLIVYCFNLVFAELIIIITVGPQKTVSFIKYLEDSNDFP